ncbi:FabD/lysophospholipase-like protein [Mytilinidion resinicola]|uniref:FabD/lysophospholipase-like protein n=1 Tax=Mytilinidion resinicola TaxID=574789 RepID=A0A6A6YJW8_9PEZI|nr:FabD/lysophospholipase-like protein [Mytilinidion resinicola]KAF2808823.1 FabD/lysophospholipase-like protein [Mytilinidion resinicola]
MSNTVDNAARRPLRLLALDGGGVRGLSELLILQEVMRRIQHAKKLDEEPLPCEYFDLIGGTSTGGLIALLLGRLKLSAESAKNAYLELAGTVFSKKQWKLIDGGAFKASSLKEAIRQEVEQALGQGSKDARMIDPEDKDPNCKAFVCAVAAADTAAAVGPTLFRTYRVARNRSDDCMIWEAGRATSAAPTFFKHIKIGSKGAEVAYLDAGLGYNNPTNQVLKEAWDIFGERQLGCIVSLGTGETDAQDYSEPGWIEKVVPVKLVESLKKIATDTAQVAEECERKFQGHPNVYFRLNVRRAIGRMALDEWKKLANISVLTGNYLKEEVVSRDVDRLVQVLIGETPESPVSLEAAVSKKVLCKVPFERNPRFTGREVQLAQLEKLLCAQGRSKDHTAKVAIIGLGGVGKTQLVLELLFRTKSRHPDCSIIWIPATNKESLYQAYLDVARELGVPGWEEVKADVKKLVQSYLSKESAGQWLLVFDNADDMDMWIAKPGPEQGSSGLINYLPKSKQGCIVYTTRDRKVAVELVAQQSIVEVPEMDEEMATQLLRKSLVNSNLLNNKQDTQALLIELTHLPLAIVQAAAYINKNGILLAAYLSLLKEQEKDVIELLSEEFEDDGRYRNIKNPVATTWLISFAQIRQRDPLAADYLSFMSCVDPRKIPQSLLPPGLSPKKEIDAIGTLSAYSFVSKRPDGALDLHRLVHLATRNWLRKEGQLTQSTVRVIERFEEIFPNNNYKNRSIWTVYVPHVRYALESDLVDRDWKKRMDLMWRYGMCLYEDGRWNEAEVPISQVLETSSRVLGEEHPDTLTSMANLASTYRNQGRWKEAEELFVQVMETRIRVLGDEHPSTLTSMANLASTYRNQGRWKEAEELDVQVMETSSRVLGEEHPDTLTSIANLASTFWNQGRWKEAEELDVQVMETSSRVLGEEHPDTLTSIANLASTFWNQGRWKEAEELDVQVMETSSRVLGEEHPSTLTSMNNLAFTLKGQCSNADAISLMEKCFQLRKQVLGPHHPHTTSSLETMNRWRLENMEIGI